jgi:hypothetical protein
MFSFLIIDIRATYPSNLALSLSVAHRLHIQTEVC